MVVVDSWYSLPRMNHFERLKDAALIIRNHPEGNELLAILEPETPSPRAA
jgi:hypothetical protein